MFWNITIPISQEMYETSGFAMLFARSLGMFPVKIEKDGPQIFLKWSPLYGLCSFIFGGIAVYLAFDGLMLDVHLGNENAIRIKSQADFITTFFDVVLVSTVFSLGVFVTPLRFSTFSDYVNCFNEVDTIIPPTNIKHSRNFSILVFSTVMICIFIITANDLVMYMVLSNGKHDTFFVGRCYVPFYVCYHAMLLSQCVFWQLVYCISKRLQLLNENLRSIQTSQRIFNHFHGQLQFQLEKSRVDEVKEIIPQNKINATNDIDPSFIVKLMTAYGKLCDAVEALNRLYGINCTVIILGILWDLIITNYALILGITQSSRSLRYISISALWVIVHLGRLVLFAHPCHSCLYEVQETKNLVCNLISLNTIDGQLREQLQDFARLLLHRRVEFTAIGLAIIDFSLITSILDAVTTYVVILVQFSDPNASSNSE